MTVCLGCTVARLQCKCIDPEKQGGPSASCGSPQYKGDGNCDDDNNNKLCEYDGGDCCYNTVKGGKVNNNYCKKVDCGDSVVACYLLTPRSRHLSTYANNA